jgi:UDP-N-acetyl-D-galactosamine dehydrogenase
MNELAIIFDRLEIPTRDVLAAAGTMWNFLPFTPGLVGGHCIGVDPYYLTARAEAVGYYPEVILAGRRINDGMGGFIARRFVKLLIAAERPVKGARVGILGITFKENVPDLRNSRVTDIIAELREFGIEAMVSDPLADLEAVRHEYGIELVPFERFAELDGLILAVPHRVYHDGGWAKLLAAVVSGGVLVDVKSAVPREAVSPDIRLWSL